jgi:hypothetical protein
MIIKDMKNADQKRKSDKASNGKIEYKKGNGWNRGDFLIDSEKCGEVF